MPTHAQPILLAVAAPLEAKAVMQAFAASPVSIRDWVVHHLSARFRLVITGVGKVNAAAAVTRALERGSYRGVLSVGIAGALPGSNLRPGDSVLAQQSVYADEGLAAPEGFLTCARLGFPLGPFDGNSVPASPWLLDRLAPIVTTRGGRRGIVATVSTCSGTDSLAEMVVQRTGAVAEAMEGAAVGHAVARFSDLFPRRAAAFAEVRVISNTTGRRDRQEWDMRRALAVLTDILDDTRRVFERDVR